MVSGDTTSELILNTYLGRQIYLSREQAQCPQKEKSLNVTLSIVTSLKSLGMGS